MDEHKIRQELYHRLNRQHSDDLNQFDIEISDDIVGVALSYLRQRDIGWVYPGKSYAVGLLYAVWLSREFGGEMLDYLDDPDLLYNNDPYFVPYSQDAATYHAILDAWDGDEQQGMVPDIRSYFEQEFMLCEQE